MKIRKIVSVGVLVYSALGLPHAFAQATKALSLALKGGESVEVTDLYYVINCRSILNGVPSVSIMDGPPGVTATITPAQVTPRAQQCSKPVSGGKLLLKADKVDDQSNTTMTLRVKYPTKDGPRESSMNINLALFPSD